MIIELGLKRGVQVQADHIAESNKSVVVWDGKEEQEQRKGRVKMEKKDKWTGGRRI